ncbi:MAG: VOC family protein [Chloroflexota bacterium]
MTTPLIKAKRLSHVGLHCQDVEVQTQFYTQMVGLGETARDQAGNIYLRCNADHHSLVLMPAPDDANGDESPEGSTDSANRAADVVMNHVALEVADIDAAAEALTQAGIEHEIVTDVELGQGPAVRLRDPDGFVLELVGPLMQVAPTYGPRNVQPRHFGHITFRTVDPKVSAEFYQDVLGFRVSDWLGEDFVWLRCTPEHHGIAISRHARAPMLHHIAFHVMDMAQLIHQAEYLMHNERILLYGPGRHGPGQNLFIYFYDTEENIVEFAADIQEIWDDEAYTPRVWDPNERWSNMWGPPSLLEFRA